jgi:hypothetical protein
MNDSLSAFLKGDGSGNLQTLLPRESGLSRRDDSCSAEILNVHTLVVAVDDAVSRVLRFR